MSRRVRHSTIYLLSTTLVLLLVIEGGLRALDPWGVLRYFNDLSTMFRQFRQDDQRGYVLPPGYYSFSNWSATILADGTRRVPDVHAAPCTLAMLGDSVTFGHGVNDADTWVNLLAQTFLSVHFLNVSANGYNIENVAGARRAIHADGYLYLLINNDNQVQVNYRQTGSGPSAIRQYLYVVHPPEHELPLLPITDFNHLLNQMLSDPQVMVVAFDIPGISQRVPHHIPLWTATNSRADGHANAEGNRQIARSLAPLVRQMAQQYCTTVI